MTKEEKNKYKRDWEKRNAERFKASQRKYYDKNKQQVIDKIKNKRNANPELAKVVSKKQSDKARKELQVGYINYTLKKQGVTALEISLHPEWQQIQKAIINIKRKIKQNANRSQTEKSISKRSRVSPN